MCSEAVRSRPSYHPGHRTLSSRLSNFTADPSPPSRPEQRDCELKNMVCPIFRQWRRSNIADEAALPGILDTRSTFGAVLHLATMYLRANR